MSAPAGVGAAVRGISRPAGLLPCTAERAACVTAERLSVQIGALVIEHAGDVLAVTAGFGCLLQQADPAPYAARAGGCWPGVRVLRAGSGGGQMNLVGARARPLLML